MASVFTRVINGELPGRIVYSDESCAAFLTIAPIRPGHTLVVPRLEVEDWLDAPADLFAHLSSVSQRVGAAISSVTGCARVGLIIAGYELAHLHLHLIPTESLVDFDFARADPTPDQPEQDRIADELRLALAV